MNDLKVATIQGAIVEKFVKMIQFQYTLKSATFQVANAEKLFWSLKLFFLWKLLKIIWNMFGVPYPVITRAPLVPKAHKAEHQ